MKRLTHRLIPLLVAVAAASTSSALMWEDYHSMSRFMEEGDSYTGEFDIRASGLGYDPVEHVITHATVGFSFSDGYYSGDRGREWVDVWIGADQLWDHEEVDGTHYYGFDWIWRGLSGSMLADLEDGVLQYTVFVEPNRGRRHGDVWLKEAKLEVWGDYAPDDREVPDGGSTFLMLCLGLLAMVGLRKRFARK